MKGYMHKLSRTARSLAWAGALIPPGIAVAHGAEHDELIAARYAAASPAVPENGCESLDLESTLTAFYEDVAAQRSLVQETIRKSVMVDAEPEPKPLTTSLSSRQLSYPLIPSAAQRQLDGTAVHLVNSDSRRATVLLSKPDTDYQVVYVFEKHACWKLAEIIDFSL